MAENSKASSIIRMRDVILFEKRGMPMSLLLLPFYYILIDDTGDYHRDVKLRSNLVLTNNVSVRLFLYTQGLGLQSHFYLWPEE